MSHHGSSTRIVVNTRAPGAVSEKVNVGMAKNEATATEHMRLLGNIDVFSSLLMLQHYVVLTE